MEQPNFSLSDLAAVAKDNNSGASWNNPMWLLWAILFGGGNGFGFGNRNAQGLQDAEILSQINSLREQIQNNQNTNGIQASIGANHEALNALNNALGLGFAGSNATVNAASMANVLGQKDAAAQMAAACCDIKASILAQTNELGVQAAANQAATQLQNCQNNSAVLSRIDAQTNAVETQMAAMANALTQAKGDILNQSERNTNSIIQSQQNQTQVILNTLNQHWQAELAQKYDDAKLELSQLKQNATLIAALKQTTTTTAA